ncbi:MAG: Ppx/GppA family phosphatase, partial [Planctomycetes bacterium]|nr:Ppx/GppA family phosphatase [Planctomycetota bacterium]
DMGSNAIRFLVAEASGNDHPVVLESHRLPVRLGGQTFRTGRIGEAAIAATVDACRRFRADCDRLAVTHVRAIATSAMRDASNRHVLADRVRVATGIEIEVISGTQEAYLLKLGVESKIDLSRGRSLLVDVGGGSLEVMVVEDGSVVDADSYRLGALRMLAAFADADDSGETFVELMQRHLDSLERRVAGRLHGRRFDRYAAVGGNIDTLAELVQRRRGRQAPDEIPCVALAQVDKLVASLAAMSIEERMGKYGLREDRADTIVPAGMVYSWVGQLAGVDEVFAPGTGIRDGLLVEVVQGHLDAFTAGDHVDVVLASCRAMGRRFDLDVDHADRVLRLGRQLFDQTVELHGLDTGTRVLLDAAALLHDVGVAVNNDGHHKHSQYLIDASELVGLDDDERHLVALIARYHRKAPPSRDHADFSALTRRDRAVVERLAAILRVADALDRQHAGVVSEVAVAIAEEEIVLRATLDPAVHSRLFLETRAVADKGALFASLYGRPVRLAPP